MRTMVWDVDDVLNDLTKAWFVRSWLPAHPATSIRYAELTQNPPHRLLGISLDNYRSSLDAFRLSPPGMALEPDPAILSWLRKRGTAFHHVALTATPRLYAEYAAGWVMRHFGDWIRTFGFVPSPRTNDTLPCYAADKSAYLGWLGKGDVLIDDNPKTIKTVEGQSSTILVPRPWNSGSVQLIEALDAWADATELPEETGAA